jgi:predicted permease
VPLVSGRDFTPADSSGNPVLLVNETLAATFFPNQDPIGRRVKPGIGPFGSVPWHTIVGVVADVKQGGLNAETGTELYLLASAGNAPALPPVSPRNMNIVVRSSLPLETLTPQIHRTVRDMDPTLPVVKLRTMDDVFGESVSQPRLLAQLLGIFAGLALLLAAIGTYGILSYAVTERRREIGIHMALGATRRTVLGMILGQGLKLTAVGLAAGVAGSLALTRLLQSQLFNVRPSDPATMAAVVTFIAIVAFIACYLPASRATRVDPMVVLRDD